MCWPNFETVRFTSPDGTIKHDFYFRDRAAASVKFLIDECLNPSLAAIARERGYPGSTYVTWLGLRARQVWVLGVDAVADGYVLLANGSGDFAPLIGREHRHPDLVCITIAYGLMSLDVQIRLFEHVLTRLAGQEISDRILEIALHADRTVRVDLYPSRSA